MLGVKNVPLSAPVVPSTEKSPVLSQVGKKPTGPEIEIWMSKEGRAGKTASLLKGPIPASAFETILSLLKKKLACGGSFKNGELVIQSGEREKIVELLATLNFRGKKCGG
jgi:translation initiation factor 1